MKTWIVAVVIGLLIVAGIVYVIAANSNSTNSDNTPVYSCHGSSTGSCNGQCSANKTCGNPNCQAAKTGICNCGK